MLSEFQSVVNTVGDLPPMPVAAAKVVQLLQNPATSANDLAKAITHDPAVSARVLKIANSSFYSMKRQVKTLEHAIVILGEKTLKSLVLAASMRGLNRSFGLMEKMLWEDSIGCAIGARLVALRFRSADPEEAFLAGLFRHVGKMVMNSQDSNKYLQFVQAVYNGEGDKHELERRFFPFSHAVIGAAVLDKWNFSENLTQATLHHADMRVATVDDPALVRLVATVNIADSLCRRLGIGQRRPDHGLDLLASPGARALGADLGQLERVLEEFQAVFEEDRDAFFA